MTYYNNTDRTVGKPISRSQIPDTFDISKPHIFLVHEWMCSPSDKYELALKNTLFDTAAVTVTVVDWSQAASCSDYQQVIADSQTIAKEISLVVKNILNNRNVQYTKMRCFGIGFGGQICGIAGNYRKLGYIIGFDPIGPGFEQRPPGGRLNTNSADSVRVHHTSAVGNKSIGILEPCGHVDYYPNGGGNQPECQPQPHYGLLGELLLIFLTPLVDLLPTGWTNNANTVSAQCGDQRNQCSHFTAVRLFIESIKNGLCVTRQRCYDFDDIPVSCDPPDTEPLQVVGKPTARPGYGNLYFTTNVQSPYCKG